MKNLSLTTTLVAILFSLWLVPSCALLPSDQSIPPTPQAGWEAGIGRPGAVLYGRDGSPVGASAPNTTQTPAPQMEVAPIVTESAAMPHRPEDTIGSRPFLLEMYQNVVTDKEELDMQLETTQQALRATEDRMLDLEQRLTAEIEARVAADQARKDSDTLVYEMGRRLAVAQMRRLEAEKLLLEKTLAERRKMAEAGQ